MLIEKIRLQIKVYDIICQHFKIYKITPNSIFYKSVYYNMHIAICLSICIYTYSTTLNRHTGRIHDNFIRVMALERRGWKENKGNSHVSEMLHFS